MDTVSGVAAFAQSYGACRWRCFPVVPTGKKPIYAGWQNSATADADRLAQWFPDDSRNIGVIAGEQFDCFDIEAAHLPALHAYMSRGEHSLPLTPIARTGRGGRHIFVRPLGLGQSILRLGGVRIGELKSTGGFIVAPPSATTGQYAWIFAPAGLPVAEAPDWLRALVASRPVFASSPVRRAHSVTEAQRGLEALAQYVARSDRGERNDLLFFAACRALEEGSSPRAVADALTEAARDCGLVRDDGIESVEATIASAVERVWG